MERAPGPKGLPYFGSVFAAWKDPIGLLLHGRETYGDVVRFKFGPFDYYLLSDPELIQHVLVHNAKAYRKSRNYIGLKVVLGDGLLTSEGDKWRKQRKLSQPAFHRDRLDAFARSMSGGTRAMLARWNEEGHERVFDLHEEMIRLTFRIVGLTLFSSDVDGDAKEIGEAMELALRWANDHAETFVRIPPSVPTPTNIRFKRAMKIMDAFVFRLISERRKAESAGSDLLGMLMESKDENGVAMDDQQLRDEIITMVLAGHETTANLLSWTFRLLSQYPEVAARVREEASRVLGDRDATLADVKALEYTRRVLEEGLRLFPPAWAFERQSTEEDVLGKYPIAKGSIVGICPYVLHRHPGHWDNPEGFDPDRFLEGKSAKRHRYAYLPFGGGPRTCIGNHFAMMEAQIILAMVVRDFRLELDPSRRVEMDPVITLRPKTGIYVRRKAVRPSREGDPARQTPSAPLAANA